MQAETQPPESQYALSVADSSYEWYKRKAIVCKRAYRTLEMVLILVTGSIPVAAVLSRDSATLPGILGAVAGGLTGLRGLFSWQQNFVRYSAAREEVEAERRLFHTNTSPYDHEDSRYKLLVAAITRIEQSEMRGWFKVAVPRQKPPD